MKRLSALLVTAILVLSLLAGCGGAKTYTDEGKTIAASVGEEFTIALDSNPTTGYNWEETHDASMLSLVEDKYAPDEKAKGLVGAGGTQYYRFKALNKGDTEVTLVYKRTWEEESIEQKVFKVNIK